MGIVVAAYDRTLGLDVAVKTLPRTHAFSSVARRRLAEEGARHLALSIAGGVRCLDVTTNNDGVPCLVLERVDGVTLRQAATGASAARILEWLAEAAEALARLHDAGLVHLDVKPDNLMVHAEGVTWVDLGLSRAPSSRADPRSRSVPGTPPYTAPETFLGPSFDGRADAFALGVTAWELLTGQLPWSVDGSIEDAPLLYAELGETERLSSLRPDLPAALDDLLHRTMSRDPEDRPRDLTTLADELRAASREIAVDVRRSSGPPRPTDAITLLCAS